MCEWSADPEYGANILVPGCPASALVPCPLGQQACCAPPQENSAAFGIKAGWPLRNEPSSVPTAALQTSKKPLALVAHEGWSTHHLGVP
jgi:hypothetical protein